VSFGRGTYQVDIFSEMHYTQVYRSQEPPRLYPATGSVPFLLVGPGTLVVEDVTLAKTADTVNQGVGLYAVNCAVCHGLSGKGDGPMRSFLLKWGGILPPDLTSPATVGRSDNDLLGLISEGGATKLTFAQIGLDIPTQVDKPISMPTFKKLLTQDERWMLVYYLRDLQGQ
jgi:mono/diheme cytochrome c family protein